MAVLLCLALVALTACDLSSIEPPPLPWESGRPRQQQPGWIGANLSAPSRYIREHYGLPDKPGAAVLYVLPKSPAARAGLRPGDLVYKINDVEIYTPNDLVTVVLRAPIGAKLRLAVVRPNQKDRNADPTEKTVTVSIGKRPDKLEEKLIESFTKELKSQPDDPVLYYLRASMLESVGQTTNAVGDYARAIELAPRFGLAYSGRARLRLQHLMQTAGLPILLARGGSGGVAFSLRDLDEIFTDAERAVTLDPEASWGYSVRAEAYLRRAQLAANIAQMSQDLTRAITDASNALTVEPGLARARLVRAIAYYFTGRSAEAQADLVLVLRSQDASARQLAQEFWQQVLAQG
jgi:tetratricopeptide (TPR) repeat protein